MPPQKAVKKRKKRKAKITIIQKWCKGCGLCVETCKFGVLRMRRNIVEVVDIDKCTLCGQCEIICPDFCIKVEAEEEE